MGLEETEGQGADFNDGAQDRGKGRALLNTVMNLLVTQNAGDLTSSGTTNFSRRAVLQRGLITVR